LAQACRSFARKSSVMPPGGSQPYAPVPDGPRPEPEGLRAPPQPVPEGGTEGNASAKKMDGRESEAHRAQHWIESLTNVSADSPWKQALVCFLRFVAKPLMWICWVYVWIFKQLYRVYKVLPMNVLQMIFGVALCFFGGVYFASIAAIEAFRNFGGQQLVEELTICWTEASAVQEASAQDDTVDANRDGIADVEQIKMNEYINRKGKVAMVAIKDPMRLHTALCYLFTAWISVIATLKLQFARTVAISLGIAELLELPLVQIFGPLLAMAMGPDLKHWPAAIIVTVVKIIAVIVAAYIQAIISAFYSGLRGGRLFAEGLINILGEKGLLDKFPDSLVSKPFDPNTSYLDELLMAPLAAGGFYYQISHNFQLEFPLDLALLPLTIVEWILKWQVFT